MSSFNAGENLEFLALIFECTDPQKSCLQLTTIVMCKSYCAEKFVSKLPSLTQILNFFMKSALYSGLLDKFLRLIFLWQLFRAFCPLFPENFKKSKEYQRFWDPGSVFSGHVETLILKFSPASATKVLVGGGRDGVSLFGRSHFKICCFYGPANIPLNSACWFLKNMLMYLKCSGIVLEFFYKNGWPPCWIVFKTCV